MPSKSASPLRYLLVVCLVILGLIGLKALIAWAAELYLYSIPIVGGWLKSLEVVELINILVFALLGLGIGGATLYLRPGPLWRGALPLIVAMPLVFLSSYWVRYNLWVNQLAVTSELPRPAAVELASDSLQAASGSDGFWGFFRFTTQLPVMPTSAAELQNMTTDQQWFRSELTRFSGLEPGIFSRLFTAAGWGIRLFHVLLALLTGVIYFLKSAIWADGARLRRLAKKKT